MKTLSAYDFFLNIFASYFLAITTQQRLNKVSFDTDSSFLE